MQKPRTFLILVGLLSEKIEYPIFRNLKINNLLSWKSINFSCINNPKHHQKPKNN